MTKVMRSGSRKRRSTYEKYVRRKKLIRNTLYITLGIILAVLIILIILSE